MIKSKLNDILLFTFITTFYCCQTIDDNTIYDKSSKLIDDNFIKDPFIKISNKNIITLKAKANFLIKNNDENTHLNGNVEADFYNDNGNHMSVMHSDSATINEINNNFKAFGNVIVISDSGFTLYTEELLWDNSYNRIISNDSVMFTTDYKDTLHGVGFESDIDLSNWKILKPKGVTYRIN